MEQQKTTSQNFNDFYQASKLVLAPMEGVTDWAMRDLLTSLGGIDLCVTEFLRVTERLHPYQVFLKNCPELKTGSRTRSGTPVFIQLLGGKAGPLAENALRAAELGALGVDLNFGCPAKTVNRHDGGATLLKSSNRIYDIVKTVRAAVPSHIPVTAKMRLGFDNPEVCFENVKACEEAGAYWVTMHCRTKTDGYKPPAYWEWIPKIKETTKVRLIANGEIWSETDYLKCKSITQCEDFMIGRASLRDPYVFKKIQHLKQNSFHFTKTSAQQGIEQKIEQRLEQGLKFFTKHELDNSVRQEPLQLILPFFEACTVYVNSHYATSRTKQWLSQLRLNSPLAKDIFDQIKTYKKPDEFKNQLIEKLSSHKIIT